MESRFSVSGNLDRYRACRIDGMPTEVSWSGVEPDRNRLTGVIGPDQHIDVGSGGGEVRHRDISGVLIIQLRLVNRIYRVGISRIRIGVWGFSTRYHVDGQGQCQRV